MDKLTFCSCTDLKCPNHPSNHEDGCNRCIEKTLKLNEIPSCFFRKISNEFSSDMDFSFEGFARLVLNQVKE